MTEDAISAPKPGSEPTRKATRPPTGGHDVRALAPDLRSLAPGFRTAPEFQGEPEAPNAAVIQVAEGQDVAVVQSAPEEQGVVVIQGAAEVPGSPDGGQAVKDQPAPEFRWVEVLSAAEVPSTNTALMAMSQPMPESPAAADVRPAPDLPAVREVPAPVVPAVREVPAPLGAAAGPASGPTVNASGPVELAAPLLRTAAPQRSAAAATNDPTPVPGKPTPPELPAPSPTSPPSSSDSTSTTIITRPGRPASRRPAGLTAAGRWTVDHAKRPGTRLAGAGLFLLVLIVAALVTGTLAFKDSRPKPTGGGAAGPATSTRSAVATEPTVFPTFFPTAEPATPIGPAVPGAASFRLWADQYAAQLRIPVVALAAYAYAEQVMAVTQPSCRLSWTTLAGIGKVASNHGRINGSTLDGSGVAKPPIIGPLLDGHGGRPIVRDTDLGAIDGDPEFDRPVGPMQFTPASWRIYGQDADGDHTIDINDIDDGALAAARLLCAGGRDMGTVNGWWGAIGDYNYLGGSGLAIFNAANDYGKRSTATP